MLEDEKDKALRARNLILAGVPEPDTDELVEGNAAGLASVTRPFTDTMKQDQESYKITNTSRLFMGRNAPADSDAGKDGLLRVRFDEPAMVGIVARTSPELGKGVGPVLKKVRIFRDRSKNERNERRELLNKA